MEFSLITPTHNPKHIGHLWESIKKQKGDIEWEWIILANGEDREENAEEIKKLVAGDERVRVIKLDSNNTNIGYLKNVAFGLGEGDILVEVDHDDILMSNCLEELKIAFKDTKIGFAYSNNAKLGDFTPYDPIFGWEHREIKYAGTKLPEMVSFKADAGSLAYIWYAPDHVRAWRKSVYDEVGGHDKTLSVCDDHDLMIRTYLQTDFYHIDKPLYIYRIDGDNTWLERNKEIQIKTVEISHKYLQQLAERDAKKANLPMVDLGGGINPRPGYQVVDKERGGYFTHDLNLGIPYPDNSVGVLNANDIIEHLEDKHFTMSEIHRVLCDGGWAFIRVPSTDGRGAFQDYTHKSFWNENSFLYYTNKDQAQYTRNTDIKFQKFKLETSYPTEWHREKKMLVTTVWLRAIKSNKRRPGLIEI